MKNQTIDIRGQQSAAILIVKPVATGQIWEARYIDLGVEDNSEPIKELKRLLQKTIPCKL